MLNIAISFDQNYLTPFYALASSIFHNNKGQAFTFHCIITGISVDEKEKINTYLAANNAKIKYYEINQELIQKFIGTISGTWTLAVYYKMFFPILVAENIDRLLYIDTDTLVINPLEELYYQNLDGFALGAVYDCYVKKQKLIGIEEENKYFNSGVMLFNLPVWRAQQISEKAIDFLQSNPDKIKFVDQDALNATLINKWKKLDYKYNVIFSYIPSEVSKKNLKKFIEDKVIIHFTLQRPWHFLCKNRYRYLYKYYLKKSPKRNEKAIIDYKFALLIKWFKIRLVEWYFDNTFVQKIWRKIKRK